MGKSIFEMKTSEMPGYKFECSCGRTHSIDMNYLISGKGAVDQLSSVIKPFKDKKIMMLCDNNTWDIAAKEIKEILEKDGYDIDVLQLMPRDYPIVVPTEETLGQVIINTDVNTGLILGVGSGTINDLSKYTSYKMKIECVVVATAPSMDGYASIVAPLIVDKHKVTYPAHYPYAVITDLDILKNAPMDMLKAGFGDIIGKYISLTDWRLTKIINNEYYCDTTVELVMSAVELCKENADRYFNRETEAVAIMNEALLLTGISIGMCGCTRPASGSEHHLAHFWELDALSKGIEHPLHGNSVGLGSIVSAEAYSIMKERFEEVAQAAPPSPDFLREIYTKANMAITPAQLNIPKEVFKDSINNAYRIRPRYTLFNFTKDKGMLPEIADIVTERMCRN